MTYPLLALLAAATLPAGTLLSVDPASSAVKFQIVHKLHRVDGQSKQIEGKAAVQEGGKVLAMVRVPASSFRTGDGNRDEHMLEVLEVDKHPYVVFKGIAQVGSGELPHQVTMTGELDFHGVTHPVTVPLTLEPGPDGSLRARGGFEVSLDAYRVERPSLLFVKIEDGCHIDLDLLLRKESR